ncbi:hypothetical protein PanNE5_22480 [Pandoraea sp. NE5]|nr:hypothetical protein PanNE5_22480 [Pandoraea sp. NE5]
MIFRDQQLEGGFVAFLHALDERLVDFSFTHLIGIRIFSGGQAPVGPDGSTAARATAAGSVCYAARPGTLTGAWVSGTGRLRGVPRT